MCVCVRVRRMELLDAVGYVYQVLVHNTEFSLNFGDCTIFFLCVRGGGMSYLVKDVD